MIGRSIAIHSFMVFSFICPLNQEMKRFFLLPLILTLLSTAAFVQVNGQFTYFEGAFGYSSTKFEDESFNRVSARAFSLNFAAIRRVARPIGFGIELGIPVLRGGLMGVSELAIASSETPIFELEYTSIMNPEVVDYTIRQNLYPKLLMRIYLGDGYSDFYFEGRFGFSSVREEFTLQRDALLLPDGMEVPELDLEYSEKVNFTSGGFAMGYQNTYDTGWFFRMRAGFDILSFKEHEINETYTYGVGPEGLNSVQPQTLIEETSVLWMIDIGTGYYF